MDADLQHPTVPEAISWRRVILHLDLDCFYAQVEHKRLNIPREVPLAVQQWDGLIAVNYAARAAGITRHMRVAEARQKCPQLQLVHVATIDASGASPSRSAAPQAAAASSSAAAAPAPEAGASGSGGGGSPAAAGREGPAAAAATTSTAPVPQPPLKRERERDHAKACLQRYRLASVEVLRLLASLLPPGTAMERASIDEVYIDCTAMVEAEMRGGGGGQGQAGGGSAGAASVLGGARRAGGGPLRGQHMRQQEDEEEEEEEDEGGEERCGVAQAVAGSTGDGGAATAALGLAAAQSIVLGGPLDGSCEIDRRLAAGAVIAARLRGAVSARLQFTCSAGVSYNKLLAKLGSAAHKPDQQTVVLPRGVAGLMADMPLGKIRGLGGKLGARLEEACGASTAGQVAALGAEALAAAVGQERALWVVQTVRGVCAEGVTPKERIKSLNSCKSFEATRDLRVVERWVGLLAEELAQRLADDEAEAHRRAKSLVLHYRGGAGSGGGANGATGGGGSSGERSIRCAMPAFPADTGPAAKPIASTAMALFRRLGPEALPCSRLALAATEFKDLPVAGAAAISHFFTAQPAAKRHKPETVPAVGAMPVVSTVDAGGDDQHGDQMHQQPGQERAVVPVPPEDEDPAAGDAAAARVTAAAAELATAAADAPAPLQEGRRQESCMQASHSAANAEDGDATAPRPMPAAPPDAAPSAHAVDRAKEGGGEEEEDATFDLGSVSIRDQQRILHELEIQRLLAVGRPAAGAAADGGHSSRPGAAAAGGSSSSRSNKPGAVAQARKASRPAGGSVGKKTQPQQGRQMNIADMLGRAAGRMGKKE